MNPQDWWAAASVGKRAMTLLTTAFGFVVMLSATTGAWRNLDLPVIATEKFVINYVGGVEKQVLGLRSDLLHTQIVDVRRDLVQLRRRKQASMKLLKEASTPLEAKLLHEELDRIDQDIETKVKTEIELSTRWNRINQAP